MGALGLLKNLFLAFILLLFVVDFVAISWVVALSGTALNPKFYEQQLENGKAFDVEQQAIADFGSKALSEQTNGLITEAEAGAALKQVISREWLKQQAYGLIENGFAYIKSEKQALELKVSLVEPKQRLAQVGSGLIAQKIESMGIPFLAGIGTQQALGQAISNSGLPDEVDLGGYIGNDVKAQLEQARAAVGMFYSALLGMVLAAIMLLLIIIGLNFRKLLAASKWIGMALLLAGIITVLSSEIARTMGTQAAAQAIQSSAQSLPAGLGGLATGFVGAFIQALTSTVLGFGIAAIAVGALLLILGFGLVNRLLEKRTFDKKE